MNFHTNQHPTIQTPSKETLRPNPPYIDGTPLSVAEKPSPRNSGHTPGVYTMIAPAN